MKKLVMYKIIFITITTILFTFPQKIDKKITSLLSQFAAPSMVENGELLFLFGQVVGTDGKPIPNARVIIWQTDNNGAYDHPDDPQTDKRDRSFKFFGVAQTDREGWYVFRTIIPKKYYPRPRHIHFKVKEKNRTLLTSQFYFSSDKKDLEGEWMFRAVGEEGNLLLLQLNSWKGKTVTQGNIYIKNGGRKYLPTPSQAEGPYFPVKNLKNFDNDLVN